MKLKINEIFSSIQGEGIDMGRPCTMIRLTGCNLRCSYCDTEYAFFEGEERDLKSILDEVDGFGNNVVELTGGEPLLQENAAVLIKKLIEKGYKTLIETNGSMDIGLLHGDCIKILDMKTPSSKMDNHNLYSNLSKLKNEDQLKFVVADEKDFSFSIDLIKNNQIDINPGNIIFSPVSGKIVLSDLAKWVNECGLDVRMQVQLHKIIWPEDKRGV